MLHLHTQTPTQLLDQVFAQKAQKISFEVLSSSLTSYMKYPYPSEIADLCTHLLDGQKEMTKPQLSQNLQKALDFSPIAEQTIKSVKHILDKYRQTLDTALDMEEDEGTFDLNGLKEALSNTDMDLSKEQYDYVLFMAFSDTKNVKKLTRKFLGDGHRDELSSIKENSRESAKAKESEDKYSEYNEGKILLFHILEDKNLQDSEEEDDEEASPAKSEQSIKVSQSDDGDQPVCAHKPIDAGISEQQVLNVGKSNCIFILIS